MRLQDFHHSVSGREGAPWMIFLHGLLGSGANWRGITPAFEGDHRILLFDQRGHGRSFKPEKGYAPEDFAGDLGFLMDELIIPSATVIGHSMGGRNALTFANLYPGRVTKLVIEDIGPEAVAKSGSETVQMLKEIPMPFPDKRAAKEYLLNEFGNPELGNFLYMSLKTNPDGSVAWIFDLKNIIEIIEKGRSHSRWEEVRNVRCPTLVIRGERSDELSRDEYDRMLQANPCIHGVEIPGAGHWVHSDKPDLFIAALKQFV
jgi:esterase